MLFLSCVANERKVHFTVQDISSLLNNEKDKLFYVGTSVYLFSRTVLCLRLQLFESPELEEN